MQRRDSHMKKWQIIVWLPEWPTQTLMVTIISALVIPSPLSSFLKIGLALNYSSTPLLQLAQDRRGAFASEDMRTHHTFKARAKQCLKENIFTNLSLKSKRQKGTDHYEWQTVLGSGPSQEICIISQFGGLETWDTAEVKWFAKGHSWWLWSFWFINKLYIHWLSWKIWWPLEPDDSWFRAQKGNTGWVYF